MAEQLSPGVFVEEVPSTTQVVTAVSTSTMSAIGFTPAGPENVATLCTSWPQFQGLFSGYTANSKLAYCTSAFFVNGGSRCYIVRVLPEDATIAGTALQAVETSQDIETGDGVTVTFAKVAGTTTLKVHGGASPLVPGAFSVRYRATGLAVTGQTAVDGAGANVDGDGTVYQFDARIDWEAFLGTGSPPTTPMFFTVDGAVVDLELDAFERGTVSLGWTSGGNPHSLVIAAGPTAVTSTTPMLMVPGSVPGTTGDVLYTVKEAFEYAPITIQQLDPGLASQPLTVSVTGKAIVVSLATDGGSVVTSTAALIMAAVNLDPFASALVTASVGHAGLAAAAAQSHLQFATFDHASGIFSLCTGELFAPDAVTAITASFTPAFCTPGASSYVIQAGTVITTGTLALTGFAIDGSGINTVNVQTGAYSFKTRAGTSFVPMHHAPMLATYSIEAWQFLPTARGDWANPWRIETTGNIDYLDVTTGAYSRWDVRLSAFDPSSGQYQPMETYEALDFVDPTSVYYAPVVINALSTNVTMPFIQDEATGYSNEALPQVSGRQFEQVLLGSTTQVLGFTLSGLPLAPRSLVLTFIGPDGLPRTVTDDGTGHLVGAVDPTYVSLTANTVDYNTGIMDLKLAVAAREGAPLTVAYAQARAEVVDYANFADATKAYSYTIGIQTWHFFATGSNGTFDTTHYSRSEFTDPALQGASKGLYALDRVDELLQVIVPDFAGDVTVTGDLLDYAQARSMLPSGGDRFIILTVPKGSTPQKAVDWYRYTLGRQSKWAAIYYPWIRVADPLANGRALVIPPLGHVAGIYARTDITKSVGKAPAGTVDGQLQGLLGLEYITSQGERDLLYPNRINPLISSPQTGMAVWGVRTISPDSAWLYVHARRLFMFLEKSIYNSTQWIVFENNGPQLWARISLQIGSFLLGMYQQGLFAGTTPGQAFFVKVDGTNNSDATVSAGQVIIDVGVAINKPAEFVRFRFSQVLSS